MTTQTPQPARIVHIRASTGGAGDWSFVEDRLRRYAGDVDTFHDVYRALASICRGPDDPPPIVLVDLATVGEAEMDVFRVLSRHCPRVEVYVYPADPHAPRAARALEHATGGPLTRDVLEELLSRRPVFPAADAPASSTGDAAVPATEPPARAVEGTTGDAAANAPVDQRREPERSFPPAAPADSSEREEPRPALEATEGDSSPSFHAEVEAEPSPPADDRQDRQGEREDEEEDESGPVRVPWVRYEDAPRRTPPGRVPPGAERTSPVRRDGVGDRSAPLLTDEELEALLGPPPSLPEGEDSRPAAKGEEREQES